MKVHQVLQLTSRQCSILEMLLKESSIRSENEEKRDIKLVQRVLIFLKFIKFLYRIKDGQTDKSYPLIVMNIVAPIIVYQKMGVHSSLFQIWMVDMVDMMFTFVTKRILHGQNLRIWVLPLIQHRMK